MAKEDLTKIKTKTPAEKEVESLNEELKKVVMENDELKDRIKKIFAENRNLMKSNLQLQLQLNTKQRDELLQVIQQRFPEMIKKDKK